jgi:hypothetical protein
MAISVLTWPRDCCSTRGRWSTQDDVGPDLCPHFYSPHSCLLPSWSAGIYHNLINKGTEGEILEHSFLKGRHCVLDMKCPQQGSCVED